MSESRVFPIQARARSHPSKRASVPGPVYLAGYEVYCHLWGEQKALIEGDCRGGFGVGELMGFLYAKGFPREEWRKRFDEAITGLDIE